MGNKFIVEKAMCTCKFGTTPGFLKVTDQKFAHINGKKLIATTMNLGNVFQPPGFTVCKAGYSKSCTPAVVRWSGAFEKVKINRIAALLTEKSKGTCAAGCPDCIEFITPGQIALPGAMQMKEATNVFQGDMDPVGESLALNENQITSLTRIIMK
ncbi:MAG: DUF4280 domain-containing protein [Candidatus Azobacteroides sp.]|nr:DUF4280 domain-containing protein [Candidatus Azobacteroides sp.]